MLVLGKEMVVRPKFHDDALPLPLSVRTAVFYDYFNDGVVSGTKAKVTIANICFEIEIINCMHDAVNLHFVYKGHEVNIRGLPEDQVYAELLFFGHYLEHELPDGHYDPAVICQNLTRATDNLPQCQCGV